MQWSELRWRIRLARPAYLPGHALRFASMCKSEQGSLALPYPSRAHEAAYAQTSHPMQSGGGTSNERGQIVDNSMTM